VDAKEQIRLISWLRLTGWRGVGPRCWSSGSWRRWDRRRRFSKRIRDLAAVDGIGTIKANQIVTSTPGTLAEAMAELERVQEHGWTLLTLDDGRYPPD